MSGYLTCRLGDMITSGCERGLLRGVYDDYSSPNITGRVFFGVRMFDKAALLVVNGLKAKGLIEYDELTAFQLASGDVREVVPYRLSDAGMELCRCLYSGIEPGVVVRTNMVIQ